MRRNGFSLMELLLVIAIIGIIAATATPFLSSFLVRNNLHVAVDRVISEASKAQSYAMDGKVINNSTVWGICITGTTFRMFNGSCASPNYREDYGVPGGVTMSGITSVTFDNLRGEPSVVSTITVASGIGTNTITLGAAGLIDAN